MKAGLHPQEDKPLITIAPTRPEHAAALEALQQAVYPTLDPAHWLRREHIESHLRIFPAGQFVALDGDRPVGMTATLRVAYDFAQPDHTFDEIIAGGFFTTHDPQGPWLYGADISVLPEYRGQGIARRLYAARHGLVQRLNLRGQIIGGMLPGFRHYRDRMAVDAYVARVVAGEIFDPTLSVQLRNGFEVRGILRGYLHDAALGDDAALLVWPNPAYRSIGTAI
ncbi:MAG TPA: GNAT family N-acetyltransferase [Herpetosiphonaceae bacterium]